MTPLKKILVLAIAVSMMALVPFVFAQEVGQKIEQTVETAVEKININKASVEELMQLKGVGQEYAKRIVEYREQQGMFKATEDILKVKGIGPKTFGSIKDLITIE